jgi:hypothetical protein
VIDHLDILLFRLLRWQVSELTANGQVRFQPPDDDWRAMLPGITNAAGKVANALNVYLVELREHRRLRTNARDRTNSGVDVYETAAPRRVDCHYLISAWSPVQATPGIDPTSEEHALLADAARVIGQFDALDPVSICAAVRAPGLSAIPVPAPLEGELLPLTLLPVEGFSKYAEFWGTMGDASRWRPCIYLVVTIPLKESPQRAGPIVTTLSTTASQTIAPASFDLRFHIGGQVLGPLLPPAPVAAAWVELLDAPGTRRLKLVRADSAGRFVFADVFAGDYQLRASSTPLGVTAPRPITVPEPSGEYDVYF